MIESEIQALRDELNKHSHLYYIENRPEISDYEFDMMLNKLIALEEKHPEYNDPNSPTKRVGGDITKSFNTIKHDIPMQSLGTVSYTHLTLPTTPYV